MRGLLIAADLYDCAYCPARREDLRDTVLEAVRVAGLRVADEAGGTFTEEVYRQEYGASEITLMVPLMESHLAVHTWPAENYVAVDLFTCGSEQGAEEAFDLLRSVFKPARHIALHIPRGGALYADDTDD